jgi:nitrogen fixation protein
MVQTFKKQKGVTMTHKNKGNFAAKHPKGTVVSDELRQAVIKKSRNRSITCAAAHDIARNFTVSPLKIGKAVDLLECRIRKCQLGLFGYYPEKKIVEPVVYVPSDLKNSIFTHLQTGRLSCAKAWELAEAMELSRLKFCAVCETLNIKISSCQLGAF